MSLTVASNQAKDKTRPTQVAANQTSAAKTQAATDSASKETVRPVSLPIAEVEVPPAIGIIKEQAKGLIVQSETDAPIRVEFWPSEKVALSSGEVAERAGQKADAQIETKTVAEFFKNDVSVEDWMGDEEKTMALRFQKFVVTLETQLENPTVYLINPRERTVVIIGKVKGGFGGVITLVVET